MIEHSNIYGHNNIVIQNVSNSTIQVLVDGRTETINADFEQMKLVCEKYGILVFEIDGEKYSIANLDPGTFDFLIKKRSFNEVFAQRLFAALAKEGDQYALNTLKELDRDVPNWTTKLKSRSAINKYIVEEFAWMPGIQLRKLVVIGEEPLTADKKYKYINVCLVTAEKLLQLICFILLSGLWEHRKKNQSAFSVTQQQALIRFFDSKIEHEISDDIGTINMLYEIYRENTLAFPLKELEAMIASCTNGTPFYDACMCLNELNNMPENQKYTLGNCFIAEISLVTILETTSFLSKYRMASVKSIFFDQMKNTLPHYLHEYVDLSMKYGNAPVDYINSVMYDRNNVNSESVFLYKDRFDTGINLFPFVIDINALSISKGAKLFFFSYRDRSDILTYAALDDNIKTSISYKRTLKQADNVHMLMAVKENRKLVKQDTVYEQFFEARNTIIGNNE